MCYRHSMLCFKLKWLQASHSPVQRIKLPFINIFYFFNLWKSDCWEKGFGQDSVFSLRSTKSAQVVEAAFRLISYLWKCGELPLLEIFPSLMMSRSLFSSSTSPSSTYISTPAKSQLQMIICEKFIQNVIELSLSLLQN